MLRGYIFLVIRFFFSFLGSYPRHNTLASHSHIRPGTNEEILSENII